MNFKQIILSSLIILSLASCGMFGIHIKIHNPKKAGKYPHFDKEIVLLGENTALRQNFDVVFYDLDLSINPDKRSIGGWVEIRAKALVDIDSLQIDLDQPLSIDELHWGTREGQVLNYTRYLRAVYVKLPQKIVKNAVFSLFVRYHGKPVVASKPPWSGGLVWKKDKQKKTWAGVACEGEGASIWFPCKDHTSDEPDSVHLRFSMPDTALSVVSNGVFSGSEKSGNNRAFNWKVSYPINIYNITFYIGDFVEIKDIYQGVSGKELNLSYYVLRPNKEKAAVHFQQVKEHIRVYEELYGEYAWYADGFKLVESPYAGMEHQTAIAYGNGYKNDLNKKDDYILLHETGHEWFGNAVSAADLADVWLQEGITTYGEYLYLEKRYEAYEAFSHLFLYRLMIKNKRPVVGPYGRRYFNYHDGDVYVKGAWILHTLRNNISNDSVFFAIMRSFYNENKLKVTNSDSFIQMVNRVTGDDYGWFFNQYLYQRKAPFLEYQYASDGTLYYRWTDVSPGFNKLRINAIFDGDWRELYPDLKIQKIKVGEGENVASSVSFTDSKMLVGLKKNKKLKRRFEKQEKGS